MCVSLSGERERDRERERKRDGECERDCEREMKPPVLCVMFFTCVLVFEGNGCVYWCRLKIACYQHD